MRTIVYLRDGVDGDLPAKQCVVDTFVGIDPEHVDESIALIDVSVRRVVHEFATGERGNKTPAPVEKILAEDEEVS